MDEQVVNDREEGEREVPAQAEGPEGNEQAKALGKNGAAARVEPSADEESKAKQVRDLLDEGYSFDQLRDEFHFSETTIRKELRKRMKPEGKLAKVERLVAADGEQVITKLGRYEIIPPEQALAGIRLQDGDYKLGFTDGIRMLLLAVRYTQELATLQANMLDPTIKMITAMREEERLASEKARGSGEAIASHAAGEVADRLAAHFEGRLASIEQKVTAPAGPNPMMGMMARVMEPLISNLMGSLVPGMTPKGQDGQSQVQGFIYKTVQEAKDAA
ncbi:MAG: hypothetical protein Q8O40_13330 [Chloroflexota bacterium]|nr:hypothetical protein [Chloroflexota bacterium]